MTRIERQHKSNGNEVVEGGIVHRCSCGWTSRPCLSNAIASLEGMDHREEHEENRYEQD